MNLKKQNIFLLDLLRAEAAIIMTFNSPSGALTYSVDAIIFGRMMDEGQNII